MFFTAGIVLLTLVINATTTGFVVRKLGLVKENEMSKRMLTKVLESHDALAQEYIANWKKERIHHGDRQNVETHDLRQSIFQVHETKKKLIEHVRLTKIRKLYPDLTAAEFAQPSPRSNGG